MSSSTNLFLKSSKEAPAGLYLVLVNVRYTLGEKSEVRTWTVRIVAINSNTAELGAMAWAELQQTEGIPAEAARFAFEAATIDQIGAVDCIGESCRR